MPTVSCLVVASSLEGDKVTEKQLRGSLNRGPSNTVYLQKRSYVKVIDFTFIFLTFGIYSF